MVLEEIGQVDTQETAKYHLAAMEETENARHYLKPCGIPEDLAKQTASSGRGHWFASGTKAMSFAFPKGFFDNLGLVSLLDMRQSR